MAAIHHALRLKNHFVGHEDHHAPLRPPLRHAAMRCIADRQEDQLVDGAGNFLERKLVVLPGLLHELAKDLECLRISGLRHLLNSGDAKSQIGTSLPGHPVVGRFSIRQRRTVSVLAFGGVPQLGNVSFHQDIDGEGLQVLSLPSPAEFHCFQCSVLPLSKVVEVCPQLREDVLIVRSEGNAEVVHVDGHDPAEGVVVVLHESSRRQLQLVEAYFFYSPRFNLKYQEPWGFSQAETSLDEADDSVLVRYLPCRNVAEMSAYLIFHPSWALRKQTRLCATKLAVGASVAY